MTMPASDATAVPGDLRRLVREYLSARDAHRAATADQIPRTFRAVVVAERALVTRLHALDRAIVVDGLRYTTDGDDLWISTQVTGPTLRPAKAIRPTRRLKA